MKDYIAEYFTGTESEKRDALNSLMEDWRNEVSPSKIIFKDDGIAYSGAVFFAADGFLPGYYGQKNKVLFVGRETRFVNTDNRYHGDYLAAIIDWYKNCPQGTFFRRILQMVQVIKKEGRIEFEDLQPANDYARKLVEKRCFGFAIMNISKYSNEAEDGGKADPKLIKRFFEDTHLEKRNYFQEELTLLDPDIIIAANLWGGKVERQYLDLCFGEKARENPVGYYPNKNSPNGILYEFELNGKKIKLIDLYHFSRFGVCDQDYYFSPVKNLLFPG